MNSDENELDSTRAAAPRDELDEYEFSVELLFQDDSLPDTDDLIRAVPLGGGRYQLLETPVWSEAFTIGDVVAADRRADGILVLGRILETSGMRTWRWWFMPREVIDSKQFADFLSAVERAGGRYQIDSGGFEQRIEVSLPPDSGLNPDTAIHEVLNAAQAGTLEPRASAPLVGRQVVRRIDLNRYR